MRTPFSPPPPRPSCTYYQKLSFPLRLMLLTLTPTHNNPTTALQWRRHGKVYRGAPGGNSAGVSGLLRGGPPPRRPHAAAGDSLAVLVGHKVHSLCESAKSTCCDTPTPPSPSETFGNQKSHPGGGAQIPSNVCQKQRSNLQSAPPPSLIPLSPLHASPAGPVSHSLRHRERAGLPQTGLPIRPGAAGT